MTREQQRKLRELKKAELTLLKKLAKQYKLRKKDYMIWMVKDDLFFTMCFFENESDGKCYCSVKMQVKPLWADDILWDILGMPDNKKEPLSLRSIGAFTVMGAGIDSCKAELPHWDVQELEAFMDESFRRFSEQVCRIGVEYYLEHISDESYHVELRELTLLIHKQWYDAAISYAESMEHGYFQNGDITTQSGVIEYCRAHLRGKEKGMYWGIELDNGSDHIRKIRAKRLDVEELAGFNHLTVFLRWSAEHDLLNEELFELIPELKERLCSKIRDPRTVFTDYDVFDGKLRTRHFNSKGKSFAKKYYTFYQGGFAHCVDKYAEKALGTEKYHCEEYQNEAYLFLPYNETYYKGLSEYIDKAWNEFCVLPSKSDGLCDTLRIQNLYEKRTISDKNKNEVNRIKSELKRSAVIFKTAERKRDENSLQSWIGRICRKLPQETLPTDRKGNPMLPLMLLLTKDLPDLPREIKGTELITVFISEDSLNDCEFEKGDFCVRTYDSLEDLEPCDWEGDIIKAFPLIPESVDNDYPDWGSGDIPEDTCDAILRIEKEEEINYFDDIVEKEYCLHKVGGYPSYIQSGCSFTGYEFIFQIVSDEKAQLMVGDDGNLYFFYNREKDDWKLHCDFY